MQIKKIVNLIFELNHLKKIRHNGWYLAGVSSPDSVGEHALRAAQIGYILAVMEGNANPEKVASILVMHDNSEARIGDHNKISARYLDKKQGEYQAFSEQLNGLDVLHKRLDVYYKEMENRNTPEGIIAKDADWLEMAFQAKEYIDTGHASAIDWINNVEKAIETKSAKKLMAELKKTKFSDWWKDLKKMTYKKL